MSVRFCRALRERGVLVTPAESIDAARALEAIDLSDRRELFWALRTVLVGRVEDYPVFEQVFHEIWSVPYGPDASLPAPHRDGAAEAPETPEPTGGAPRRAPAVTLENWLRPDGADAEPVGIPTVGDQEVLSRKDFSTFGKDELEEITRVATRLVRRMAVRPSRRWRPVRRGTRVYPRGTLRRAFRTGGEMVELTFRERRPKRIKLVLLCDVSGSMDLYSRFLLQFVYALQNCFRRVETFVFSTRLSRVTEELRGETYARTLHRLSERVHDWSGGTRIGASLTDFLRQWPRLVDRRTVVVVLSDGWDTGEPEELGEALRGLRRQAGKLIWLNPLLGNPAYQPLTRGMQAALPHLDVFAPAHNLASLQALTRHLTV